MQRLQLPRLDPRALVERGVRDGHGGLGGEGLEERLVLGLDPDGPGAEERQHAEERALVEHGHPVIAPEPAGPPPVGLESPLVGEGIRDVQGMPVGGHPARRALVEGQRAHGPARLQRGVGHAHQLELAPLLVGQPDVRRGNPHEQGRRARDLAQHRVAIQRCGHQTADPREGLQPPELSRQPLVEARVGDGDGGVIRQRLEQAHVLLGEPAALPRADAQRAQDLVAECQGNSGEGNDALGQQPGRVLRARVLLDVLHHQRRARLGDPPDETLAEAEPGDGVHGRARPGMRPQREGLAFIVQQPEPGHAGVEERHGVSHHAVEHLLQRERARQALGQCRQRGESRLPAPGGLVESRVIEGQRRRLLFPGIGRLGAHRHLRFEVRVEAVVPAHQHVGEAHAHRDEAQVEDADALDQPGGMQHVVEREDDVHGEACADGAPLPTVHLASPEHAPGVGKDRQDVRSQQRQEGPGHRRPVLVTEEIGADIGPAGDQEIGEPDEKQEARVQDADGPDQPARQSRSRQRMAQADGDADEDDGAGPGQPSAKHRVLGEDGGDLDVVAGEVEQAVGAPHAHPEMERLAAAPEPDPEIVQREIRRDPHQRGDGVDGRRDRAHRWNASRPV